MINKNTILSVYTDKQTLLEYLTKIETALDKAVLTSSQLVYEGANNYHFKFVFEDGSSNETPSITLVQPISKVDFLANGNSVHFVFTLMDGETITTQTINLLKPVTAAAVRDGILYLTLSDGTEVNAGSITASFGATTFNGDVIVDGHLKVNGTIEQGSFSFDLDFKDDIKAILPATLICNFAHARVSNGKLNLVVALYNTGIVENLTDKETSIAIPEEVGSKLYPALLDQLDAKNQNFVTYSGIIGGQITCTIIKNSNTKLILSLSTSGQITQSNCLTRFEFNFIF
jgi:hypothetical protein